MTGWAHGLLCDDRRQRVTRPGLEGQEAGDRGRASKETRFPWLHAREIRHLGVAYHFPIRVGGRLDVPVVGLVVDRGDGGHGRGGRDGRPDGRVLLLNRHVGRAGVGAGGEEWLCPGACEGRMEVEYFEKSRGGAASGGGRALGTKKGGIGELFTAWMQLQAMCGLAGPGWVAC